MEASQTGTPDAGQTAGGQQDQGQQSTPDFSALETRMNELHGQVSQLLERDQYDDDYDYDDGPDGEYEDDTDGDVPVEDADEQELQRQLNELLDQKVQERLSPYLEQQRQQELQQGYESLEETYPELQTDETAEQVVSRAEEIAESLGRPELVQEPALLALVYRAMKADQRAEQETPAGTDREVRLEAGGATTGAPDVSDDDLADRIVQAGRTPRNILG